MADQILHMTTVPVAARVDFSSSQLTHASVDRSGSETT